MKAAIDVASETSTDTAPSRLRRPRPRRWSERRGKKVLASEHAQRCSVEWKDSHARRKANRLIHDPIALIERGYLKLLGCL
ncbi:DNA -binding domain-containing protein [Bradyrhizobium sp. CCBAU 53415]|uniref:DNA -binding domain-containing protein n=1 Tax=Bradyrhizobium sp. CCBAU 53415 TaxID=1325119 RepID=UPI0023057B84|nr:DUF2285 domain-containing protein [Bradyrhizobium sp. CCBAU 53415]